MQIWLYSCCVKCGVYEPQDTRFNRCLEMIAKDSGPTNMCICFSVRVMWVLLVSVALVIIVVVVVVLFI